jgi:hypothetical protein
MLSPMVPQPQKSPPMFSPCVLQPDQRRKSINAYGAILHVLAWVFFMLAWTGADYLVPAQSSNQLSG